MPVPFGGVAWGVESSRWDSDLRREWNILWLPTVVLYHILLRRNYHFQKELRFQNDTLSCMCLNEKI